MPDPDPLPSIWAVPYGQVRHWAESRAHQIIVICLGYGVTPAFPKQLTTGCTCRHAPRWYPGRPADPCCPVHGQRDRRPAQCTCYWYPGTMDSPPEMEPDPDCQLHWTESWQVPCECRYHRYAGPHRLAVTVTGTLIEAIHVGRDLYVASWFEVHNDCHWHRFPVKPRGTLWTPVGPGDHVRPLPQEPRYLDTLDEDERHDR